MALVALHLQRLPGYEARHRRPQSKVTAVHQHVGHQSWLPGPRSGSHMTTRHLVCPKGLISATGGPTCQAVIAAKGTAAACSKDHTHQVWASMIMCHNILSIRPYSQAPQAGHQVAPSATKLAKWLAGMQYVAQQCRASRSFSGFQRFWHALKV